MRPLAGWLNFPDAGFGLVCSGFDEAESNLGRTPRVRVDQVALDGQGEDQECFPKGIELELVRHAVAHDVRSTRVARQAEMHGVRYRSPVTEIGRSDIRTLFEEPGAHPTDRVLQHDLCARHRGTGMADIADVP